MMPTGDEYGHRARNKCLTSIVQSAKTPSVSVMSTSLSVCAIIIAAICISAISETLYHRTLRSFAQAALNSITSRVVQETGRALVDSQCTLDGIIFAAIQNSRIVPTSEDAELLKTGIVRPLGPSVANESTGPFIYNIGSKIANSSLAISTWRDFFGSQLASLKLSRRMYSSDFDAVFDDGSYLTMLNELGSQTIVSGILDSKAVLYDGALYPGNQSYYVRRTPLTDGYSFLFDKSRIVASNMTDRRKEQWFTNTISEPYPRGDVTAYRWMGLRLNATTGSTWLDLAGLLGPSLQNNIGRARLAMSIDDLGWVPQSYRTWIPLDNVQTYTYSEIDDVIIGAEEFTDDPRRSLHRVIVPSTYELTSGEITMGCVLGDVLPGDSTKIKTCRHTVSTYGNKVLQKARDTVRNSFSDADARFRLTWRSLSAASAKVDSDVPTYDSFSIGGSSYYVSASAIKVRSNGNGLTNYVRWVTVSFVAQDEVTGVLKDVRAIVISVTAAIVVVLALMFSVGTHLVLRPVKDVAYLMKAAAYLNDTSNLSSAQSTLTAFEAKQVSKQLKDRRLSRWAEVRAIQESYYAMSDELQALKAYIPEHLREEIVEKHLEQNEISGSHKQLHKENTRDREIDVEDIELRSLLDSDSAGPLGNNNMGDDSIVSPQQPTRVVEDVMEFASSVESVPLVQPPPAAIGIGNTTNKNGHTNVVSNPLTANGHHQQPNSPSGIPLKNIVVVPPAALITSIDQLSVSLPMKPDMSHDPYHPIFFADSCLIDRDITVVHLNIVAFHIYARRRHPTVISSDYAEFITFINAEVKRFGGVLESFFGDKIWVSFNATSKCVNHQIAACYFATRVTSVTNETTSKFRNALAAHLSINGSRSSKPTVDKRFAICLNGINCGVSTGGAYVGPLGNNSIKRHSIISNAISEAVALERMSLQYMGCNVFASSTILTHVEGYLQYMLIDASQLPGSQKKRRVVSCIMGPMLSPSANVDIVRRWLATGRPEPGRSEIVEETPSTANFSYDVGGDVIEQVDAGLRAVPTTNRFTAVNECFKAVLRNNVEEALRWLPEVRAGLVSVDIASQETQTEFDLRQSLSYSMVLLIESLLTKGVDGRTYTSSLGDVYLRS